MEFLGLGSTPESSYPSSVDFLADRSLIEKYAKDPTSNPSLPKLIDLTLRQNLESGQEPYQRLLRCHRVDLDERTYRTVRRIRANKTLTLMLASAIHWNLDEIEKDMSITMQFCLVQDLMNTVFSGTTYCSSLSEVNVQDRLLSSFIPAVLQTLEDHCIFGLMVYARWILRAQIQRKIPKKAAKFQILSFGNITDPDVLEGLDQHAHGSSLIWRLFKEISQEKVSQTAVDLLEYIVKLDKQFLRVPVPDSFVIPMNNQRMVEDNTWQLGMLVDFMEFKVQILYDLAGYWLFEGKICQCAELLQRMHLLIMEKPVESFVYWQVDREKLLKMCLIAGVAAFPSPSPPLIGTSPCDLTPPMKGKLLEALLEDLPVGKLSAAARSTLEFELLASEDNSEKVFFQKVRLCNLLREYVSGSAAPSAMQLRSKLIDSSPADLDWFRGIVNGQRITSDVRTIILEKMKFLADKNLLPPIVKTRLTDLLGAKAVPVVGIESSQEEDVEMKPQKIIPSLEESIKVLLDAVTYASVKNSVWQIGEKSQLAIKDLIPTWASKIPPGLEASFGKATWTAAMADTVFATFAKSSQMAEEGCFRAARQLLKTGRSDWHSFPKLEEKLEKKLEKNLRWQNMYLDLVESQQQLTGRNWSENVKSEADKRAKICMKAAFFKTPDEEPVPSYVQDIAVIVLFNLDEWAFVKEVTQDQKRKTSSLTAVFPLLKQLNAACIEFQQQKEDLLIQSRGGKARQKPTNRQECGKLWNMLASILSRMEPPQSVLRKPGGLTVAPPIVSPDILWSLVRSIRHKASLHLLFNCFCRMWSIVNSDTGGLVMTTDSLWPATLPIHVSVPPMEINKAMEILVEITEALGMDDPEIVTIKGDFHLHLGELEKAVKMYLLSGLPGSLPGFLHSPTAPFFQQTTLRKLISAFESLRCHTYVAVLCQLTLPLDYDTAFRSVAEKVTFDAADQLYYFLWDPLILEHAAFMMQKFGFLEKRQILMDLLQNPVLNSANPLAVAHSVATERATEFSEILFDQYVLGS